MGVMGASMRLVALRRLDWDTEFFGVLMGTLALTDAWPPAGAPAARAAALAADVRAALAEAARAGYAHLIFRVPAEDLAAAWGAAEAGLRLVDIGVDSTFAVEHAPALPAPHPAVRPARPDDLPALQAIAADSFVFSRFAADPFFTPAQVRAFHRQWITNLCAGLADTVLVFEAEGEAVGFVSCARMGGAGRIPLIATHARLRRAGVGRALVTAALRWFAAAGVSAVHVKTQAQNYPALALYHRLGFTISKTDLTFSVMPREHELRAQAATAAKAVARGLERGLE
jgi:ribosomal protein S18 acetylase RimI-like enzyme